MSPADRSLTRIVGVADLAAILTEVGLDTFLDQLIGRLATAFAAHDAETVETEIRRGFTYGKPAFGLVEWMPAHEVGRVVAIKTVGYHPDNPVQHGLASVLATTSVYETETGRLAAVVEGTVLTALRTGAASAVATDVLARTGDCLLGIVGAGAQAVTQAHAISRIRPVTRILAVDRDPEVAASLPHRLAFLDIPVEVVDPGELPDVLAEVDVLCTCTSVGIGEGPVVEDGPHRPWLHVNAVGSDFPGKVELPEALLARSIVCPDVLEQCIVEGEAQRLRVEDLGPDLAGLVRHRDRYEAWRSRPTVFDSTGWSLEDLVASELVLEHADRLGLGVLCDLQVRSDDPYDPYRLLR